MWTITSQFNVWVVHVIPKQCIHLDQLTLGVCVILVTPDREHMYHLTVSNTWTRQDVSQVFSPYRKYFIRVTVSLLCHRTLVFCTSRYASDNCLVSYCKHPVLSRKSWGLQDSTFDFGSVHPCSILSWRVPLCCFTRQIWIAIKQAHPESTDSMGQTTDRLTNKSMA